MRERFPRLFKFFTLWREEMVKILRLWPEAMQSVAIVTGWSLVTFGIASLWRWEAWPLSFGVLILSLVGWSHLRHVFGEGLYALSRPDSKKVNRG